jgi:gluconokinase
MPWLESIHAKLVELLSQNRNAVLACSALKRSYRDLLTRGITPHLVYLKGSYDFIANRLHSRRGHFADEHILAGQFADLEEPTQSEAVIVDIAPSPETIVDQILQRLNLP